MKRILFISTLLAGLLATPAGVLAQPGGGGNGGGGNSGNAPGHDTEGAGNSENAPGHDPGGPSSSSASAPGHNPGNRGNSESAPGQVGSSKVRSAATPPSAVTGRSFATSLPQTLLPSCGFSPNDCGGDDRTRPAIASSEVAGALFGSALPEAVTVCREGIVKEAAQFGALSVDAFSAGSVRESSTGGQIASLTVRIVYPDEVKEAPVECHLDANGTVVAVEDA